MPGLVPGIDGFYLLPRTWRAGTIGERSDAVLRTAMASEATLFCERLWRAKRRRSANGYGERSDAVLRTAMSGQDVHGGGLGVGNGLCSGTTGSQSQLR